MTKERIMTDGAVALPVAGPVAVRLGMDDRDGWQTDFVAQSAFAGSVSRASGAYVWTASGGMAAQGVNTFRYDVNPATLGPRGLLVEESRTNVLLQSRTFTTTWSNAYACTLVGGQTGLFGDNAAYQITGSAANSRIEQTITVTASAAQYVYALVKAGSVSAPFIRVDNASVVYQCTFDLSTKIVTDANANCSSKQITALGNGWYCIGFGYTPTGTSSIVRFYPGVGSLYLDGMQHGQGAYGTSFITTTTAAATRAYDSVSMVDLATLGIDLSAFTMMVEWEYSGVLANTGYVLSLSDGTYNNYVALRPNSGNALHGGVVTTGASAVCTLYGSLGSAGVVKQAFAVSANDFAYCVNGGSVQVDTAGAMPTLNKLFVGCGPSGSNGFLNGWVRKISLYNGRFPDAQLQALTA